MLDVSKHVQRFLQNLRQPKQYKQIASKIFALLKDSTPPDARHLSGYPGYFRVDSGEYRIVYRPDSTVIKIVLVGKRNDDEVYKEMRRVL